MDLVNILFMGDMVSDGQNGKDACKTSRVMLNALRDPDWHDGSALAQMTKDFRKRLLQFDVNAVAVEAELRERDEVLDPESYIVLRRENSAVRLCFGMFGFTLGLDLPDEIFEHPVLMRLHLAAVDMICWANDLYSYNMEQAMGHTGNNIMAVLIKAHQYDIQAAADHVGTHFKQLVESFEADKARLPSWGPELDAVVSKYVMAMETWVREEVKRTLVVELYPKHEEHGD
ncbi:hypothetical protein FOMPIDRAFT_1048039 [Fomitopsis schrenkii]|uniref:Terpene synthase n=1 Tax=Fomitopsis schrenkii TaxID=2126942 RepID=S8EGL9_FOMSC|nr:hypothetical protein FOMPIDRAFT_1048039 [Fomitopsis schrenkii]